MPSMTVLGWLSSHLPAEARLKLLDEYAYFSIEPAVKSRFESRIRFKWAKVDQVLRETFPFNLSRHGYDYWTEIAEALPYGRIGEAVKRQARRERARGKETIQ